MVPKNLLPSLASLTFFVMLAFALLRYLNMEIGEILDWVVGIGIFWWLTIVVVVPWNMHFAAREIVDEARESEHKNIKVHTEHLSYARRIARIYLWVAILLHIVTAVALSLLAWLEVTPLGYIAALATLLLTLLRPGVRMYEFVVQRLSSIRHEVRFPREDVVLYKSQIDELSDRVHYLEQYFNENAPNSFLNQYRNWRDYQGKQLEELRTQLEVLKVENAAEHVQLERIAEESIASISEDARFLNQVRDLIRFVKSS